MSLPPSGCDATPQLRPERPRVLALHVHRTQQRDRMVLDILGPPCKQNEVRIRVRVVVANELPLQ